MALKSYENKCERDKIIPIMKSKYNTTTERKLCIEVYFLIQYYAFDFQRNKKMPQKQTLNII